MGAALLDLIARGGSMAASADLDRLNAETARQQAATELTRRQQITEEQQAQAAALEIQAKQRALEDSRIFQEAMGATDGTPEKMRPYFAKMSGPGAMGAMKQLNEWRKSTSSMNKDQIDIEKANNEQIGAILQAVSEAPEESRGALWQQVLPKLDALDKGTFGPDVPTADQLKFMTTAHGFGGKILDQRLKEAQTAQAQAATKKTGVETAGLETAQETGRRRDAASQLAAATSKDDYQKKLDALPYGVAKLFPPPDAFDPAKSPAEIRRLGMTSAEQSKEVADEGKRVADAKADAERIAATIRGQNMTDARARELAAIARDTATATRENKPPTAAQSTVASYAARIKQSTGILDKIDQGFFERFFNKAVPDWVSFLRTEAGQSFDQAERDFINAVLRRESGAVISEEEFANARKQYIPQPGEKPAQLKQKREDRLIVQETFKRASGKAYEDPDELLRAAGAGGSPGAPTVGTVQDGYKFKGGDPAKQESWEKVK